MPKHVKPPCKNAHKVKEEDYICTQGKPAIREPMLRRDSAVSAHDEDAMPRRRATDSRMPLFLMGVRQEAASPADDMSRHHHSIISPKRQAPGTVAFNNDKLLRAPRRQKRQVARARRCANASRRAFTSPSHSRHAARTSPQHYRLRALLRRRPLD